MPAPKAICHVRFPKANSLTWSLIINHFVDLIDHWLLHYFRSTNSSISTFLRQLIRSLIQTTRWPLMRLDHGPLIVTGRYMTTLHASTKRVRRGSRRCHRTSWQQQRPTTITFPSPSSPWSQASRREFQSAGAEHLLCRNPRCVQRELNLWGWVIMVTSTVGCGATRSDAPIIA